MAELSEFFTDLTNRYMNQYTPKPGSGYELIERSDENEVLWRIVANAFNYHDEAWFEFEDISIRFSNIDENCSSEFEKSGIFDEIKREKCYELVNEIANHSQSMLVCNRGMHIEPSGRDTDWHYTYEKDVEFYFINPFNLNTNIYLRYSKYSDRW